MRFVLLTLLFGVILFVRGYFVHYSSEDTLLARTAMSLGFILLAGFYIGYYAHRIGVPRITGYLLSGILCGPFALNVIQIDEVRIAQFLDELALALIAFTAGGEIKLSRLKKTLKPILFITVAHILFIPAMAGATLYLLNSMFPFLPESGWQSTVIFFGMIGIIAACKSPATSVAVILETGAKGPVTDTVLGVTILKDVVIIIFFTISLETARSFASGSGVDMHTTLHQFWEIALSLVLGFFIGTLPVFYLKYIQAEKVLFIFAFAVLIIILSKIFGLHSLLVAIFAGFMVENFSTRGEVFVKTVERASTPVFLIFFAIAGATLNLETLAGLWYWALALVVIRLAYTFIVTYGAAKLAGSEVTPVRYSWSGFIGQAGVSLGFLALVENAKVLPDELMIGFKSLVMGGIILNQIIGPVVFKYGLARAGEVMRTG